ncbi:hypothetical protein NP493_129g00010 [Ridgeia piscesae]|uniref:Reverse transcriptase/retrotransposon-derived protein RNase H-like domain-containing protein n=1 Tax=Ridgeia piscesae TaxID=27915 RepID=A0AAD9P5H0_RIDPI|nr:hypothetical protein NP493_129g00010 [Ridgeia piscesae]
MSVQGTYVLLVTATTAEQRAKELLLSEEVLAHYDANKPILLQDDASNYGIGAAHSHIMEDGIERPVGFGSRTLNAAERNYSQLDKEGAALIFAFKNFHNHINGGKFRLRHRPAYNDGRYKIHYQAGRSRGNADCLSRMPLPVTVKEEPDELVLLIKELDFSLMSAAQVRDIFFGNEDNRGARFIQLEDCGHVLEVKGLNQWMDLSE